MHRPEEADGPPAVVPRGDRRRRVGGALVVAACVAAGLALGVRIVATQTWSVTGLLDLRIYLGASRLQASGLSLYQFRSPTFGLSSTYPPLWTLAMRPLTLLDVHVVEYLWTGINLALWGLMLWVLAGGRRRPSSVPAWHLAILWLATLVTVPLWNTLNQGQVNLALWALLALDLRRVVATGRGGWGTGLASAVKLTPALVGVLLVAAGRVRAAVVAGLVALGATALASIVVPDDSVIYWTELVFDSGRVGSVGDGRNNALAALPHRVGAGSSTVATALVLAADVAVVALAGVRFRRAVRARALITAVTVAGLAMALVSPITWGHHLIVLCVPLLLLLGRTGWRPWALLTALVVALVDPGGFGTSAVTATVRTAAMVALLVLADRVTSAEVGWRGYDAADEPLPVGGAAVEKVGSDG